MMNELSRFVCSFGVHYICRYTTALRKSRFSGQCRVYGLLPIGIVWGLDRSIATSKGIAGLILDVDRDENSDYDEDDREFLKTLFKPFLAFAAKAQEATYQIGG